MVKDFWTSWVLDPHLDDMRGLTLKLKSLKKCVKDWSRIRSTVMKQEFLELDYDIQSLLASDPFGLLSVEDMEALKALRGRKAKLLAPGC